MVEFIMAASGTSAEKPVFPPFDPWHFPSQIFWTVLLFGFMYFVLSRFILPKLGSVIEVRENTLADDLDEAARLSSEAEEAQKAVELRMAEARNKARETASRARAKLDAEIAEETARVDAELAKKLEAAEARITTLRSEAMSTVDQIAAEAVQTITSRFDVKTKPADAKSAVSKILGS
ncbi:MAG: hypothetical protein AAF613_02690 [Pseudomonadota bacterium]